MKSKNVDAMFNAGLCYAELENIDKSKELLKKVTEIDPGYAFAYYALALAFEKEADSESAIENYEKFMELSSDEKLKKEIKDRVDFLKSKMKS